MPRKTKPTPKPKPAKKAGSVKAWKCWADAFDGSIRVNEYTKLPCLRSWRDTFPDCPKHNPVRATIIKGTVGKDFRIVPPLTLTRWPSTKGNHMQFQIRCRFSAKVLFEGDYPTLKVCVEAAVNARADLAGAYLAGAYLARADLVGAKNIETCRLDTGETVKEYREQVVPALIAAGGKSLSDPDVAASWNCHKWENCPMHAVFGISGESEAPVLHRPRVKQFVQLFDAGWLPAETIPGLAVVSCPTK